MCTPGDVRTVVTYEPCTGLANVARRCAQSQTCERNGWKVVLTLGIAWLLGRDGSWEDLGAKSCTACPTRTPGQPLPPSFIKMPVGGWIQIPVQASGPGFAGALMPDWLNAFLGPMPAVAGTEHLPEYAPLDGEHCELVIDLMNKALEQLKATGRLNEAQDQEKAIAEVRALCREYFH